MPEKTEIDSIANILAALGNPNRLVLVRRLSAAERFAGLSIVELTEGSGLTRQAITKHLEALADAGLVSRRKPGRATWYELNADPINNAIGILMTVVKQRTQSDKRLKSAAKKFFS